MSNVLVDASSLTAIGDAIRNKNGSTVKYKPSEMATAINSISTTSKLIIPKHYVELKNQFIDTGVTPDDFMYEIALSTSDLVTDWNALFGCRVSDGGSKCFGIIQVPNNAGQIRLDFDETDTNGTTTQANIGNKLSKTCKFIFPAIGHNLIYKYYNMPDTNPSLSKKLFSSSDSVLTTSIYLGAYHRQDNDTAIFTNPDIKIFSFTMYYTEFRPNNINAAYNFIPATYDGKEGMYETINGTFHGVDGSIVTPTF